MSDFGRMIAPFARRIGNMLARGSVSAVNASSKMQTLQVRLMADESKDAIEHFEAYGLTSRPKPGAEALAAFFDGDRSHGVVICVADRRYRLTGLEAGEVALYDDLGQSVHLTRSGIVIKGAGLPVTITDTSKLRIDAPLLECTGQIKDLCDSAAGKTMSAMRETYNSHTHHENDVHGETSAPTQGM